MKKEVRQTVAGLVVRPTFDGPVMAIHYPIGAALVEAANCTTVGGGIGHHENIEAAMRRELEEEYGLVSGFEVFLLEHERFRFNTHGTPKEYHWCLVVCQPEIVLRPNQKEISGDVSWVSATPNGLSASLSCMSSSRRKMIETIFPHARLLYPDVFQPLRKAG